MPAEQLLILALIQGLTEFLPISSSGHLVLAPRLLGWDDQGLAYDVAAHAGSLAAVVAYFRRDLIALATAAVRRLGGGVATPESRLALWLTVATVPVCIVGFLGHDFIATRLRSTEVIAWATIGFGIALGLADRCGRGRVPLVGLGARGAWLVGLAQCLALIPGTSRSGVTMTAGLALGLERRDAARFSFLLAVPVIFLASVLEVWSLAATPGAVDIRGLAIVFAVSALSALICIWAFLNAISRIGMLPFVAYRLALGGALLAWF